MNKEKLAQSTDTVKHPWENEVIVDEAIKSVVPVPAPELVQVQPVSAPGQEDPAFEKADPLSVPAPSQDP